MPQPGLGAVRSFFSLHRVEHSQPSLEPPTTHRKPTLLPPSSFWSLDLFISPFNIERIIYSLFYKSISNGGQHDYSFSFSTSISLLRHEWIRHKQTIRSTSSLTTPLFISSSQSINTILLFNPRRNSIQITNIPHDRIGRSSGLLT